MKIVHVITRLNVGGAALSVLELAAGQRRGGHEVLVVAGTIPPGEASMEYLTEELQVPYLHLPALTREISPRHDVEAVRRLQALLREQRPDVVHTHTAKAGMTGRVAARTARAGRPHAVVHTFHGHVLHGYFDQRRERVFRQVERGLARVTNRIIAVSSEVRDDLVELGVASPGKIEVVEYGFDLETRLATTSNRDAQRAKLGVGANAFVIGWVGRLSAIKRPLDLIRVLHRVPDSTLVIAGDGELRGELEQLAAELGLRERVQILGYVEDMGGLYAAFDAFLLVSANEGAPVVAIEALASGIPVVATDAGGTATVVDDGETGYLAPIGAIETLATLLVKLRDDATLRAEFGREGARRMRARFSTARMVDHVELIYERILAR